MHTNMSPTVIAAVLAVMAPLVLAGAEAGPEAVIVKKQEATIPSELLAAEHRSDSGRSAEPDSFLDRIADLFGGGPPKNKVDRRPPSPVYRPQTPSKFPNILGQQQQQPSVQRPVQVQPPAGFKKPNLGLGGLQTSSSYIKRQSTGETKPAIGQSSLFQCVCGFLFYDSFLECTTTFDLKICIFSFSYSQNNYHSSLSMCTIFVRPTRRRGS